MDTCAICGGEIQAGESRLDEGGGTSHPNARDCIRVSVARFSAALADRTAQIESLRAEVTALCERVEALEPP